ncbi:MAG: hypothetical protein D6768_07580 [Chloroflexi bacterium]|nr:MAG: hypothetical protein D6768_07580 [Chloroflexota bacterium]
MKSFARQVALFPVLLLVETDERSGQRTLHPLPLEMRPGLALRWLWLLLDGWLAQCAAALRYRLTQNRWTVRLRLEIGMAAILGRSFFSLAALGR